MATKKWYGSEDLARRLGPMTLAKCIRANRMAEELSQTAFAKKVGISRANLCDIEKGRKAVSPARAAKMAQVLGLSETYFVALCLQDILRNAKLPYKVELKAA
jgi:transcriptional regulator with XRE-family HTH domain